MYVQPPKLIPGVTLPIFKINLSTLFWVTWNLCLFHNTINRHCGKAYKIVSKQNIMVYIKRLFRRQGSFSMHIKRAWQVWCFDLCILKKIFLKPLFFLHYRVHKKLNFYKIVNNGYCKPWMNSFTGYIYLPYLFSTFWLEAA